MRFAEAYLTYCALWKDHRPNHLQPIVSVQHGARDVALGLTLQYHRSMQLYATNSTGFRHLRVLTAMEDCFRWVGLNPFRFLSDQRNHLASPKTGRDLRSGGLLTCRQWEEKKEKDHFHGPNTIKYLRQMNTIWQNCIRRLCCVNRTPRWHLWLVPEAETGNPELLTWSHCIRCSILHIGFLFWSNLPK